MNSIERVDLTLNHKEPDRIPFDLGGTELTSIHHLAYQNLRRYLGMPEIEIRIATVMEQLAVVDEDVSERLYTDFRPVVPGTPASFTYVFRDEGSYTTFVDEWGIGWRKPKQGGFYFDMVTHPLASAESLSELKAYTLPDPSDDSRFSSLEKQAVEIIKREKAGILVGPSAGLAEMYSWLRGYENFYIDLAINHDFLHYMLDKLVDFKLAYWTRALKEIGNLVKVVIEADDLASQNSLLMSTETYRSVIKPHQKRLFSGIKRIAPVKIFYHSCGAIRPLVGDLIDVGIDILNPVQISATGMNLPELKKEFGRDLVFWGGGVDTQRVLGTGKPHEVKANVQKNIEALAPGGGFVFAAVHDIQPNVPPENIMAMWEAWQEFGVRK